MFIVCFDAITFLTYNKTHTYIPVLLFFFLFPCSPKQANKMSVSVQQILADAKRLAGRLKDHDSSADLLLSQAQAMFCQVDAMKEVHGWGLVIACGSNFFQSIASFLVPRRIG
jgi:hypothetical protein